MKKYLLVVGLLALAGCAHNLTYEQTQKAKLYCTSRGMETHFGTLGKVPTDAYCTDSEDMWYAVPEEALR